MGDLVKHIFSAEKRYVDRLSDRPITDVASVPTGDIDALVQFGQQSRRELREFIEALPAEAGETPIELKLMNSSLTATPKKIVTHVLLHEVRH